MVERFTRPHMADLIGPFGLCEAVSHGGTLFVAGQTGMDRQHRIVEGGLKAQARQAFANIKEIMALAGGREIVSLTWYLADNPRPFLEDALDVTAARDEVFPYILTGSTAVRVASLLTPEILVEIQAVCAL
ncbi:MAG: RidA family protein [Alphaproteobacteria bacterium]|nr:RidA family protein [Alphaproteobacteria bacterium]